MECKCHGFHSIFYMHNAHFADLNEKKKQKKKCKTWIWSRHATMNLTVLQTAQRQQHNTIVYEIDMNWESKLIFVVWYFPHSLSSQFTSTCMWNALNWEKIEKFIVLSNVLSKVIFTVVRSLNGIDIANSFYSWNVKNAPTKQWPPLRR